MYCKNEKIQLNITYSHICLLLGAYVSYLYYSLVLLHILQCLLFNMIVILDLSVFVLLNLLLECGNGTCEDIICWVKVVSAVPIINAYL